MCKCEKERERERENEGSSWHDSHSFENSEPRRYTRLQPYSKTRWLVYFYFGNISKYFFRCFSLSFISSNLSLLPGNNVGHRMAWFGNFCGQSVRLSFSTSSDLLKNRGFPAFFKSTMYHDRFFLFSPLFQSLLFLLFVVGTLTPLIALDQLLNETEKRPSNLIMHSNYSILINV